MKKKINIAIVGLGNIGLCLYQYLSLNKKELSNKTNVIPNIVYVSAKNINKKRKVTIPKNTWSRIAISNKIIFLM